MRSFEPGWVGLILLRTWCWPFRLQRLASVALCLAEAGHGLQVQSPVAARVVCLPLRQPDLRQHVPHACQRRASGPPMRSCCSGPMPTDMLRSSASRIIPSGSSPCSSWCLHSRSRVLLRPPSPSCFAALRGGAQAASPQRQPGSVVGAFDASNRTRDLFLDDPAVLPHPGPPSAHDKSCVTARPGAGAGPHRLRRLAWAKRRRWTSPITPTTCITSTSR